MAVVACISLVIIVFACVVVWIPYFSWSFPESQVPIRDEKDCPDRGSAHNGYWSIDVKLWSNRCVLKCHEGYEPSRCHVLRRLNNGWNFPNPKCIEKPLVSKQTFIAMVAIAVFIFAVVSCIQAMSFVQTLVVYSVAAIVLQTCVSAAGGWSAEFAIPPGIQALISHVASILSYVVSYWGYGCEPE